MTCYLSEPGVEFEITFFVNIFKNIKIQKNEKTPPSQSSFLKSMRAIF